MYESHHAETGITTVVTDGFSGVKVRYINRQSTAVFLLIVGILDLAAALFILL